MHDVVRLKDKLEKITEHWQPGIAAQVNDHHVKLAKIHGEFTWHSHPDTDELFLVLAGELSIELRDRTVHLFEGDLFVVPKGVEHRPVANSECHILMIEPDGTVNTGNNPGAFTVDDPVWL